jgi:hypothetical protein
LQDAGAGKVNEECNRHYKNVRDNTYEHVSHDIAMNSEVQTEQTPGLETDVTEHDTTYIVVNLHRNRIEDDIDGC